MWLRQEREEMSYKNNILKKQLLKRIMPTINELVLWCEKTETPSFDQIENAVLYSSLKMRVAVAEMILNAQNLGGKFLNTSCPDCGELMHSKGQKTKIVHSQIGDVTVRRSYYYCKDCKRGFYPLDEQLELSGCGWSERLIEETLWLSKNVSNFELMEEIMNRIGGLTISDSTIWRQVTKLKNEANLPPY